MIWREATLALGLVEMLSFELIVASNDSGAEKKTHIY